MKVDKDGSSGAKHMSRCASDYIDSDFSKTEGPAWLARIVESYIVRDRPRVSEELAFYANQPSLEAAIEVAALARTHEGKCHSHQRRIPASVLEESMETLMQKAHELQTCQSFEELIGVIGAAIRPIHGIGELTVYDTALHIGAYLGLSPDLVYIHSGTRTGLKQMGLFHGQKVVSPEELPGPFDSLKPQEIEDCLCIYKRRFRRIVNAQ